MLINIQLLRFVAAFMVLAYHTAARLPGTGPEGHGLFAAAQSVGFAGVDIFFVISGYIMAFTTHDRGGPGESRKFTARRLARIYSGYWPFFILALAVFWWARPEHVASAKLLPSLLLWPQPMNLNLLELSWTLSFEMYFYALFALMVWWIAPRFRLAACLGVMLLLASFNLVRHFGWDGFAPEKLYTLGFWDQFLSSPFIVEFFAGAVLAQVLARRSGGNGWPWLLTGITLFCVAGAVNELAYGGALEQGYHVVPRVAWFGAASLCIVAGLVQLEQRGRVAPAAFSLSAGGASYALYLAHVPLLYVAQQLGLYRWASAQPFGLVSIAYFSLMAMIVGHSILHFRLVERPLHRAFRRRLGV